MKIGGRKEEMKQKGLEECSEKIKSIRARIQKAHLLAYITSMSFFSIDTQVFKPM